MTAFACALGRFDLSLLAICVTISGVKALK
jgi:hypothetical protein